MFFALSEQLDLIKGIQMSHDELRRTVVQHLRENPSLVSTLLFIISRVRTFAIYAHTRLICPVHFLKLRTIRPCPHVSEIRVHT